MPKKEDSCRGLGLKLRGVELRVQALGLELAGALEVLCLGSVICMSGFILDHLPEP